MGRAWSGRRERRGRDICLAPHVTAAVDDFVHITVDIFSRVRVRWRMQPKTARSARYACAPRASRTAPVGYAQQQTMAACDIFGALRERIGARQVAPGSKLRGTEFAADISVPRVRVCDDQGGPRVPGLGGAHPELRRGRRAPRPTADVPYLRPEGRARGARRSASRAPRAEGDLARGARAFQEVDEGVRGRGEFDRYIALQGVPPADNRAGRQPTGRRRAQHHLREDASPDPWSAAGRAAGAGVSQCRRRCSGAKPSGPSVSAALVCAAAASPSSSSSATSSDRAPEPSCLNHIDQPTPDNAAACQP